MNRRRFVSNSILAAAGTALSQAASAPAQPRSNKNPFGGLDSTRSFALEDKNLQSALSRIDRLVARGPFQPNWDSLHGHQDAEWFRDAKFGIYTHWGPVTVGSSFGPDDSQWYGMEMYQPSHPAFGYHKKTFGDQSKVGYKDIIPKLTGEHFNADHWADVVANSGAKFAGPVAMHHDNFAMWNSSLTRWNSVLMGPRRDIVGELARAYRSKGLRFMTSFHHGFAWRYYEPSFQYDGADPRYADLYTEKHEPKAPPSKHFQDRWLAEVYEVLETYQPDLIYFDFEFYEVISTEYQQRLFATAYDWAAQSNRTISVTQKDRKIHDSTGILDFERGREDRITPYPWLDDTAIGPWFYEKRVKLKSTVYLLGLLADIVSKNGCLLVDVSPMIDGTFPPESEKILSEMGGWLRANGEAIYGTRPFSVYGEGPTHNAAGASFSENKDQPFTGADIRYTTKGPALYAIFLGRPAAKTVLRSVHASSLPAGRIQAVTELASGQRIQWRETGDGVEVTLPEVVLEKADLGCALKFA